MRFASSMDVGRNTNLHSNTNILKDAGGGERDRTDDLLNANQMLSQLSYAPLLG